MLGFSNYLTGSIGCPVILVVLVVDLEDCKGLLAGYSSIMRAFCGLDGLGGLGSFSAC